MTVHRQRRATLYRARLLATLLTFGCSGDRTASSSYAIDVEVVSSDAVQVVGTPHEINRIADLAEGADGTIWILDSAAPFFLAMTPDGAVSRAWGRSGGGPNEFRNPNALVADRRTGAVRVYDRGRHALLRIDGPEDAVASIPVPHESIPMGRIVSAENLGAGAARAWIRSMDSGFLLAVAREGSSPFTRLWHTDLLLLTEAGDTRVAFSIAERLGDPAVRFGPNATEFVPYPLWAACPDGTVALYDPLANAIQRLAGDGSRTARTMGDYTSVADSIPLPPERGVEITMDGIFRMAYGFFRDQVPAGQRPDSAALYADLEEQWEGMQARSSPVFPEYADLQCTGQGTLWLQVFDPERGMMGRSPVWFRIDAAGAISGFHFPETFRPLRFESTRALGIERGEFDIESVAWLNLPAAGV